jgi:hypothetical protein
MSKGRYIVIAALLVALSATSLAGAAAEFEARAKRPSYDPAGLQLVGAGSYRSEARRPQLRITVCLRKKIGRQSFDVRCESATGAGRRVRAQVSVPGCVAGVWRTTVVGEAFNRRGAQVDSHAAVSRRFRC